MKAFLRSFSAFLLCATLLTLTLWQKDAFPDLSGITAFVQDTLKAKDAISEVTGNGETSKKPTSNTGETFPEYTLSEELDPALETAICNALLSHAEAVDLSAFRLSEHDLQAVISEIRFTHPEFFYVDKEFSYRTPNGFVTELKPNYLHSAAETQVLMAEYEAIIDSIVAGIPEGSDFDKLLYLHDYFVQNYCYDYTYTIRDAYSFFKQKTGVCQAYMLALMAVTEQIGIESIPVTSSRMNHAWNLVKLDGEWYHIDVTWDDAVSYPSYTSYDYFLQSDAGLIAIDADSIDESVETPDWHCDWAATKSATNVKYDNAVWRGAHTPMVVADGTYYCVVSESDEEGGHTTVGAVYSGSDPTALSKLFAVNGVWRENGELSYVDCFAGLALYNGELIYNTNNTLRAYHIASGTHRLIGFLDIANNESVFGICGISSTGVISCVVAPFASGEAYRVLSYQI